MNLCDYIHCSDRNVIGLELDALITATALIYSSDLGQWLAPSPLLGNDLGSANRPPYLKEHVFKPTFRPIRFRPFPGLDQIHVRLYHNTICFSFFSQ